MTTEGEEEAALTMRVVLTARDVVAAGRVENVLQVPSPIYTAEFTDAHHVLIGAGGGGRKFGMANIALLLHVRSLRSASGTSSTAAKAPPSSSPPPPSGEATATASSSTAAPALPSEAPVWGFAAALDLGVDIPWCTSTFLPFDAAAGTTSGSVTDPSALSWSDGQRRVLHGLVGFIALSSITAFSLIGVYRGAEPTSTNTTTVTSPENNGSDDGGNAAERRYLRLLARITVPNDAKDPDKKPIALSQNVLVVAHDDSGVHAYALTDLVPDSFEDEDTAAYEATYGAQVKTTDGALQRCVPRVQTAATPIATWQLPARVNDLAMNRVCIVQAEGTAGADTTSAAPCKAHLHEHLVLAALLQNKTVVLGTLRLRRKYASKARESGRHLKHTEKTGGAGAGTTLMATTLTLTGAELPLPFKLLTSSLRLVRLFGWGDIDAAQQSEMRRQLTWQSLQEKGAATHGALCSLAVVAFNTHACESFIIHGAVHVSPTTGDELALALHWAQPHPTPVLGDAITSMSACADVVPGDYHARLQRSPVGAAVPTHFLVGTVEGWVASVRWEAAERRWRSDHVRPSPLKSIANRFPALHKEPVSCVAVSAENDVVSADIAQNVALTTVPLTLSSSSSSSSSAAAGGQGQAPGHTMQPRLATSSALFPTSLAESGLLGWVMTEIANGSVPARGLVFLAVPLLLLFVAMIIMMR